MLQNVQSTSEPCNEEESQNEEPQSEPQNEESTSESSVSTENRQDNPNGEELMYSISHSYYCKRQ